MEENYSRGKRFGDKFWNGKTLDVLSVGFLFCFGALRKVVENHFLEEARCVVWTCVVDGSCRDDGLGRGDDGGCSRPQ
ncbi:hypothetical protein QL285_058729 [Trifolium repens]|nr:hypothetical protein QL285_058729 [Trifolium repens]